MPKAPSFVICPHCDLPRDASEFTRFSNGRRKNACGFCYHMAMTPPNTNPFQNQLLPLPWAYPPLPPLPPNYPYVEPNTAGYPSYHYKQQHINPQTRPIYGPVPPEVLRPMLPPSHYDNKGSPERFVSLPRDMSVYDGLVKSRDTIPSPPEPQTPPSPSQEESSAESPAGEDSKPDEASPASEKEKPEPLEPVVVSPRDNNPQSTPNYPGGVLITNILGPRKRACPTDVGSQPAKRLGSVVGQQSTFRCNVNGAGNNLIQLPVHELLTRYSSCLEPLEAHLLSTFYMLVQRRMGKGSYGPA